MSIKIHILNARDYIMLDVVKENFNLNFAEMGNEIRSQYNLMIDEARAKGIDYFDLKNIITPQKDKKDICLVFDTLYINESFYGYSIFKKYFPLISKFSEHCVFEGDFIGSNEAQEILKSEMSKNLIMENISTFRHSSQYSLVYINRLTDDKINKIINELKSYKAFTGYFDFTYSNLLKEYISNIIGQRYFIYKNNIVMSSGEDDILEKDINTVGYDFEKYSFHIKSISNMNYNLFLTYKIERRYYKEDISDQLFSLSIISNNIKPLQNFKINIEDKKLEYLLNKKYGSMKASKILNMDKKLIEKLILEKIDNDYIFNLEINEHNTLKFNTIIELGENPFKLLVSLEYLPEKEELRLITMY